MTVRIRDVELVPFAVPFRTPLATARGGVALREGVVVRLAADDGSEGLGEAAPHPHAPRSAHALLLSQLVDAAELLRGADLARADELLDAAGALGGAAAMGLDMALHDLVARRRGVPVAKLLGGACVPVPASALLGDDAVGDAARALAAGFRVAKLKAVADPDATVALVAAVVRAAPGLVLRVDANGAWDAARTERALRALDPDHVAWIEQPVPAHDLDALAASCRHARALGHRIAADESVRGPEDVRRLAALRAAHVIVVKLVQTGGLRGAVATASAARDAGLDLVVTTGLETSLGTAAALHLASALITRGGSRTHAAGISTAHLLASDLVTAPFAATPLMLPPAGPGLGVGLSPLRRAVEERGMALGGIA